MPNTAQINRYIISHGSKDQLLAMFDQTLLSDKLNSADPWYIKSLFDLTNQIRSIAKDAVIENATFKLSPLETEMAVDCEIVKLYWHFFSNQKGVYDNIVARYKGIERLKAVSHIINAANFCAKNPENISADLKMIGFEEWGSSFINLKSQEETIKELKAKVEEVDKLQKGFDDAINSVKAYRKTNKLIQKNFENLEASIDFNKDDEDSITQSLNTFVDSVFSVYAKSTLTDTLTTLYAEIVKDPSKLSNIKNLALQSLRGDLQIDASEHLHTELKIKKAVDVLLQEMESLEDVLKDEHDTKTSKLNDTTGADLSSEADTIDSELLNDIDYKDVHTKIINMMRFDQGEAVSLSFFEHRLLNYVNKKLDYKLTQMPMDEYREFEVVLLEALDSKSLSNVEAYFYDGFEYEDDLYSEGSIDIDKVHPELQGMMNASLETVNNHDLDVDQMSQQKKFEHQLRVWLEDKTGVKLANLHPKDFNDLEPFLIQAIRTHDLTEIETFIMNAYSKKIPVVDELELKPSLVAEILWPRKPFTKTSNESKLMIMLSIFNNGEKFKKSKTTSDFNLKSLVRKPEMMHFYEAYAKKMCSYTPSLSNANPLKINIEDVDQRFKEKTSNFVFKFSSLVNQLECQNMTKEEVEDLEIYIDKTINKLNRDDPKPYEPIAAWTLKRIVKLNKLPVDIDQKQIDVFTALYTSDFEDKTSEFEKLFLDKDELSSELKEIKHKFDLLGGLSGLNSQEDMLELVKYFNLGLQSRHFKELTSWLDKKYVESAVKYALFPMSSTDYCKQIEGYYDNTQHLSEVSKNLIKKYEKIKYRNTYESDENDSTSTFSKDQAFYRFINFNEKVFRLPLYKWPDHRLQKMSSFMSDQHIDYVTWDTWIKEASEQIVSKDFIDIRSLYEIISTDKDSPEQAIEEALNWLGQNNIDNVVAKKLSLVEEKHKKSKINYQEAKNLIENMTFVTMQKLRSADFLTLRASSSSNIETSLARSKEQGKKVLNLIEELEQLVELPLDMPIKSLLKTEDYTKITQHGILSSTQEIIEDHTKDLVTNAAENLYESESLLSKIGYHSDFSDETKDDLSTYQVFFKKLLPFLQQPESLTLFETSEEITFSPKALKDVLNAKKTSCLKALESELKVYSELREKNKIASNFANQLRLIYHAFSAVDQGQSIEEIRMGANIPLSGYNPGLDRPMMIQLMQNLKPIKLMEESSLVNVINILRHIQQVKMFDKNEVLKFLPLIHSDKRKDLESSFENLKVHYGNKKSMVNVKYENANEFENDFYTFIDAIRLLQKNDFDDFKHFSKTTKEGLFTAPLDSILEKMNVEQIIHLINYLGLDSKESIEIKNALSIQDLTEVLQGLNESDEFIDVDMNENVNSISSEKTLFFLNQHYPELYDSLFKEYKLHIDYDVLQKLESYYLDYLMKEAKTPEEKAVIGSISNLALSGFSNVSLEFLMYLLPTGGNRKLLDQLISQFAPSWAQELKLHKTKDSTDIALSAQLLIHHGAAKLFNNNFEYHMPSQVANLSMLLSLTMFIVSFFLWSTPIIYILGSTLVSSIFMKICVEHSKAMALKPYAISDQLGLMESIEQIESIWIRYDKVEAKVIMKMLEDFCLLKDSEPLFNYDRQFPKRLDLIDLVKLSALEKASDIRTIAGKTTKDRVVTLFNAQKTFLEKKLIIKELDVSSNIVLSNNQLERVKRLKEHASDMLQCRLPKEDDAKGIKELLISFYKAEYPDFSKERLDELYDFIFVNDHGKRLLKTNDPLHDFDDQEVAKFLSDLYGIKKIKAQLEDYSGNSQFFPSYSDLEKISDITKEDLVIMQSKDVKSFDDLNKLIDPHDFTGRNLYSAEHNDSVKSIIEDHMKSSGDNLRMVSKISPMTMFGSIKVEENFKDEIDDQSSLNRASVIA